MDATGGYGDCTKNGYGHSSCLKAPPGYGACIRNGYGHSTCLKANS